LLHTESFEMATKIYSQGSAVINVPVSEKIAVFSNGSYEIYKEVGYPNHPTTWTLLKAGAAGETYTSDAFAAAALVRVDMSADYGFYEVGSAPVVAEPMPDQEFADATGVIAGIGAAQGGSATLKGGTSATAGNAGGAAALLGGQPGATGVGGAATVTGGAGGATSGKGGAVTIAGGAGTNGNASGGAVIIAGGAKNGSGLDGAVINRGTVQMASQASPQTATNTATLTAAKLIGKILVGTPTSAAAYTVPTGTDLKAALPTDLAADDSFDVAIINLGATTCAITLTANTDITIVGDPIVGAAADIATAQASTGRFRFRFVSGTTFVAYRL
jgi:hypothetical protein